MMLWSLTKVILFVVLVAALALGAALLSETGETIRIVVSGWEFTIGPVQAVVLAVLLCIIVWLALQILGLLAATFRFLNGDETAISRYFDSNRERKGYRALSDSMMALASGEPRLALTRAQNAERLLGKPELTTLLVAQAAEASGDRRRATEAYKALLKDDATRFVGVRGLLQQKLAEGDREVALKLAEKAFDLRPKHAETQDILLKLQSDAGDWSGARTTLGAKLKAGSLPRDVYRRRDAVLALQQARTVMDDAASIEAREAAIAEMDAFVATLDVPEGKLTLQFVHGAATLRIIEHEQTMDADLVVMGKHGQSVMDELLLGSVTKHVLAH
jgi:HemY protein